MALRQRPTIGASKTCAGLTAVPERIFEAAKSIGLTGLQRQLLERAAFASEVEGTERRTEGLEEFHALNRLNPKVVGELAWTGPRKRDELAFLKTVARRPVKANVVGPISLFVRVTDHYYEDEHALIMALADTLNRELRALAEAGADVLQIDEPMFHLRLSLAREHGVEAIARTVAGIDKPVLLHACYGYAIAATHKAPSATYAEAVLAESESHVAVNEAASVAGLNGVAVRTIAGERGHPSPAAVADAIAEPPGSAPDRRLRLVWLENTHNRAGGTVMPKGWLAEIAGIARARDLPIHIDGARIFNAAHAQGVPTQDIARGAKSLTLCLTKAPAAPHGAILLGCRDFIAEAERVQKMFGGLWRPASSLAAAAVAALKDWPTQVEAAHERARQLARGLAPHLPEGTSVAKPETNIVMLQLASDEAVVRVLDHLATRGIRASNYRRGRIRFVTHSGHTAQKIDRAVEGVLAAANSSP